MPARRDGLSSSRLGWEQTIPAVPSAPGVARDAVLVLARRSGAFSAALDRIRLGVSEAVSNVVQHAYPGGIGDVSLLAAVIAGPELVVIVADDGCGFDTPSPSPGLGMGMKLMAQLADDLVIGRRGVGGTEVRLLFHGTDAPSGAGPGSPRAA